MTALPLRNGSIRDQEEWGIVSRGDAPWRRGRRA
jgi:hypothetical protein